MDCKGSQVTLRSRKPFVADGTQEVNNLIIIIRSKMVTVGTAASGWSPSGLTTLWLGEDYQATD